MSLFTRLLASSAGAVHEHVFATGISFTVAGLTTPTPAVLHAIEATTRTDAHGSRRVITRRCRFTNLDTIRHDAIVTIGGDDWTIEDNLTSAAPGVTVRLIRELATQPSRRDYRR